MNKILKRLLTGVLTLATVFTALPTTAVHAAETQYWTESEERVGIVEKVMNDGSIGSTFNEGHMTVEGEDAYCIDINTGFKNGYKTRSDASTRMTAYQIEDVALSLEYVKQYTKSHTGLSSQHAYLLRQLVVWQRLSVHLGWSCDNVRASYDEISKSVQDEVFAGAKAFVRENKGRYSYAEHYVLGDVFVLTSPDKEKGTLLELKGKGCRQMESYLLAQHRSWYDFLMDALVEGGVMKRLDLAINDMAGILDIPELTEKCNREECISVFRSFKSYRSGELVRSNEQDRYGMGNTLYIGSLKSEVYFCIYEKDYEQYVKYDIPIEDTKIKNRFEIRLKNERAYYAVRDLLTYHDAERTAFDIINRYMRFADKEVEKRRSEWQTNEKWAYFIGSDRGRLKLTTKPEPYTLTRTLNWISRQVAPTWKVLQKIDSTNGTTYLKDILDHAKLTERHKKLIEQQTTSTEEMITETEE